MLLNRSLLGLAGLSCWLPIEALAIDTGSTGVCSFEWWAEDGDTCVSMASSWDISEDDFKAFNPGVDCDSLISGQHYCVEWTGDLPPRPSSSTSAVVSSTTTSPVARVQHKRVLPATVRQVPWVQVKGICCTNRIPPRIQV